MKREDLEVRAVLYVLCLVLMLVLIRMYFEINY
jgi:hypothetical protein